MARSIIVFLLSIVLFGCATVKDGISSTGQSIASIFSTCNDCKKDKIKRKYDYKLASQSQKLTVIDGLCRVQSDKHAKQQLLISVPCSAFVGGCSYSNAAMVVNNPSSTPFNMSGCIAEMSRHPWESIIVRGMRSMDNLLGLGIKGIAAVEIIKAVRRDRNSDQANGNTTVINSGERATVGYVKDSKELDFNFNEDKKPSGNAIIDENDSGDNDSDVSETETAE